MTTLDLLDRPIAYHRVFVTITGSVKAAVLLSQAVYWQKRAKQADGWWYKSAEEWEEETGLSRREQETARRDCEKFLKTDLRGVPATLYWKVDEQELENALSQFGGNVKTGFDKNAKQDSTKTLNINKNTETTTENILQQPLSIENAIYADQPITEEMTQQVQLRDVAPKMFEKALQFSKPLPWWNGKDWTAFGEWVCERYAESKTCFGEYQVWRGTPYTKGGISNQRIRGFVAEFYDSWDMFLMSRKPKDDTEMTRLL